MEREIACLTDLASLARDDKVVFSYVFALFYACSLGHFYTDRHFRGFSLNIYASYHVSYPPHTLEVDQNTDIPWVTFIHCPVQ